MDKKEDLINAVVERASQADKTKKLTCAQAFELAEEFEVKLIEVGRVCNQHDIKLSNCQLGCF